MTMITRPTSSALAAGACGRPHLTARLSAQQPRRSPIPVTALNHMTLTVSDLKRSVDFYQALFGMPIQARQGATVLLRIGAGPQFIAIAAGGGNAKPGIGHFCLTTRNFNADRLMSILARHGVTKADGSDGGLSGGPMNARVRVRFPIAAGPRRDADSTSVIPMASSFAQDRLLRRRRRDGNLCPSPEPAPARGALRCGT